MYFVDVVSSQIATQFFADRNPIEVDSKKLITYLLIVAPEEKLFPLFDETTLWRLFRFKLVKRVLVDRTRSIRFKARVMLEYLRFVNMNNLEGASLLKVDNDEALTSLIEQPKWSEDEEQDPNA